jgi:hypothetical protein
MQRRNQRTKSQNVASTATSPATPNELVNITKDTAEKEVELQGIYSNRRRHLHQIATDGRPIPTMYTPETQNRVSPTLPLPKQTPKREGNHGLVAGGPRELGRPPLSHSIYCTRG